MASQATARPSTGQPSPAFALRPAKLTGMGRPLKIEPDDQTISTIVACGQMQFGVATTAAFLGIGETTLREFFRFYPAIKGTFDDAKLQGKGMLRGKQMQEALGGNTGMLVWLGKQYLGQRDKMDIAIKPDLSRLTDEELDQYDRLNAKALGRDPDAPLTLELAAADGEGEDSSREGQASA